ncbi:hypothetical protein [Marmoricola sp. RAF53]|uniref:hypothetical protein n=1 Tax=Marmoricola sp. RAF53 TaxID=3233059 RepID=UPI003F953EA5
MRRLGQYLVTSAVVGLGGLWLGARLVPVPGQLFADVLGVPLVYVAPLVVAVSLAHGVPEGDPWFERRPPGLRSATVIAVGLAVAFLVPLVSTGTTEVSTVAARDGVLLSGLVLALRSRLDAAATTAAVIVPNLVIWTFGWDATGTPRDWALLLAPASSNVAAAVAAAAFVTGAGLYRRRRWPA